MLQMSLGQKLQVHMCRLCSGTDLVVSMGEVCSAGFMAIVESFFRIPRVPRHHTRVRSTPSNIDPQETSGSSCRQYAVSKYAFNGGVWVESSMEEAKALIHFCGEFTALFVCFLLIRIQGPYQLRRRSTDMRRTVSCKVDHADHKGHPVLGFVPFDEKTGKEGGMVKAESNTEG
jgi:hypothetical protein